MAKGWTAESVLELARGYQVAVVLMAAAELDVFTRLKRRPQGWRRLADEMGADIRATRILLDALAAIGLLEKHDYEYQLPPGLEEVLAADAPASVLPMLRHQANCHRRWTQLAQVVKNGRPAERELSFLGEGADTESFIRAMHVVSAPVADELVASLGPPEFTHVLDVGGGPGTWTIALLKARPEARATLFDLPQVIPIAREYVQRAGLAGRVTFAGGDFAKDPLPEGADLAWVGAIIHMNSRDENRALYVKVRKALAPGGRILIRDVLMDETRTAPPGGALFAVNMLVSTPGGQTYTFAEVQEDLSAAGFDKVALAHKGTMMDSVVEAVAPE